MSCGCVQVPVAVLTAATGVGATGPVIDLGESRKEFTLFVTNAGSGGTLTAALYGSHDGTNWAQIVSATGPPQVPGAALTSNSQHYVRYVQAKVEAANSPTGSASVSAYVASA
jgi:hypothetical protein